MQRSLLPQRHSKTFSISVRIFISIVLHIVVNIWATIFHNNNMYGDRTLYYVCYSILIFVAGNSKYTVKSSPKKKHTHTNNRHDSCNCRNVYGRKKEVAFTPSPYSDALEPRAMSERNVETSA